MGQFKAKTIREHFMQGTTPRGKGDTPSVFKSGRPKIPAHLSKAGRTEFKRVCKILLDRGTSTEGDFATLAVYAEIYARWIQAKASIETEGLMITAAVTDNHGKLRTVSRLNPLIKVAEGCESRMLSLCKSMGLTAVDRDKVKQTSVNPKDEIVPGSIADLYPHLVERKPQHGDE